MNSITYSKDNKNYIACKIEKNADRFTVKKIMNNIFVIEKHIIEYSKPNNNRIRFEITTDKEISIVGKIDTETKTYLKLQNILFPEDVMKPEDYYENYPIEEQALQWEVNNKQGQEQLFALDNLNVFYSQKATTKKYREDFQETWEDAIIFEMK